jgi:hypothetical protein
VLDHDGERPVGGAAQAGCAVADGVAADRVGDQVEARTAQIHKIARARFPVTRSSWFRRRSSRFRACSPASVVLGLPASSAWQDGRPQATALRFTCILPWEGAG